MGILVGIVYSTTDLKITQIITPDNDSSLTTEVLKPGEALMQIPRQLYQNHSAVDDLARTLGLTPFSS